MFQLGLFAKYWQPGKVKTRLAAGVGELAASRIYRTFLEHLVGHVPAEMGQRWVVYSPEDRLADFQTMIDSVGTLAGSGLESASGFQLVAQCDGDLGMRMSHFFRHAFDTDAGSPVESRKVIVIGSDTPTLSPQQILEAEKMLDQHQVVLGPCTDGGYYFVALRDGENRESLLKMFTGIDWSTPQVLEQTLAVLKTEGINVATTVPMTDIDQLDDLLALVEVLKDSAVDADRQLLERLQQLNSDPEIGGFLK